MSDRYSSRGMEKPQGEAQRSDVSKLFGDNPDVIGIREAFEKNRISRNDIEPYFKKIAEELEKSRRDGTFPGWSPEKRLANAIVVAAYLRAQNLKTNQVRKVLEMARTIELKLKKGDTDIKDDVVKTRYLLAYTVGRATGGAKYALDAFHRILDPMLALLTENTDVSRFEEVYDFLQAVVAYHRFFGGGE
ncbi:type III-A CRISPR-associated protein Csm2 [Thermococcus zilligii]|uniref:type III-A CRISPR-associated protein Csm2 n=1 Tax=Thermococcus zilligii TaxID=54076 RepID=UPI00029AC155|nr:type III-A CRISPR-associated protein Csm2 [Thermococcus zilligii]